MITFFAQLSKQPHNLSLSVRTQFDEARVGVVESLDETDDGRLAAPGRPDQRDHLTLGHAERHALTENREERYSQ